MVVAIIQNYFFSDEKCLLDYPLIKDGTKINLVVKRTDEELVLRNAVVNFLRPRFSENDTQKIADEFMKVFNACTASIKLYINVKHQLKCKLSSEIMLTN